MGFAMRKIVNGRAVDMTAEEVSATQAEWAKDREAREAEDAAIAAAAAKLEEATGMTIAEIRLALRG